MSFLNKLFSFFHGGNSASDTSTDPAYAHMPDNIFHGTSIDPTAIESIDTVNNPAYATLPENVSHDEPIASVPETISSGWDSTDTDFSSSSFGDSFSSSGFGDSFGSGFDSGFSSGSSFGSDF